jgi:hypothetical protein
MLVSKECWERGCSCYDDRVDKDPVEVVKREWVGLTDEERYGLYRKAGLESYHLPSSEVQYKYDRCIESYARAIEAKLKEKNT